MRVHSHEATVDHAKSCHSERAFSPGLDPGEESAVAKDDTSRQVSHETIYRSLFIQARGALKKELLEHLRRTRVMRRSRHTHHGRRTITAESSRGHGLDQPASWGALQTGRYPVTGKVTWAVRKQETAKDATLVERHTRYVMLVKVAGKDTETVINALIKNARKLPQELYKSLTWDRGKEMADHKRFTLATDIQVYFCDPQNPWQRGTNENTNGLLRQYLPREPTCLGYHNSKLNAVARSLNERPRKLWELRPPAERFFHLNCCIDRLDPDDPEQPVGFSKSGRSTFELSGRRGRSAQACC